MTGSYRSLAACAMLAMTIGIAYPALAQEKQSPDSPQPSPSAPGANRDQATNPPAPSGGAPADKQSGTQPSNNQASNPPTNNNSGANQPADQGVQTVTGDLVPGYDPIALHPTETVTTQLEVRHSDGTNPSPTTAYKLVTGAKEGTPYAYVETPLGRWPVHEVAVLDGKTFTTMYALGPNSPLISVPADAKPFTRARNEDALTEVNRKQSGERQPPPDQEQESPRRGQSQQGAGAKAANASALENNDNKKSNNKDDNNNREQRTERAPAGHSSKSAAAPSKLQQAVAATEAGKTEKADTSHMGVASKKTDSPAMAHETAPPTKLDSSHLGTASNGIKPASAPASTPAGKLTAFDTSHLGGGTRLQSLSRPALPAVARTLASQH